MSRIASPYATFIPDDELAAMSDPEVVFTRGLHEALCGLNDAIRNTTDEDVALRLQRARSEVYAVLGEPEDLPEGLA